VTVASTKLWTPELSLLNPNTGGQYVGADASDLLYVLGNTVGLVVTREIVATCNVDLLHFPYDTQTCSVMFLEQDFPAQYVILQTDSNGVNTDNTALSDEWSLINASLNSSLQNVTVINTTEYSIATLQLTLARVPYFFTGNIIWPSGILIFMVALVFVLPSACGEKVGYSATLVLAIYVMQQVISLGCYIHMYICVHTHL
jgi:hypothetical protein